MDERKTSSKSARSIFFEPFNEIDVYVEDTAEGYRKIYRELLNKVFEGKIKIEHVLPLGDRNQVIEECRKNQELGNRKRIYIVDGDLYLINGNDEKSFGLNGLFVLPRYCIENYLIEESAIIEVYYRIDPELDRIQIQSQLDFENWISVNENRLVSLFIIYALCNKYSIKGTVSYKVSKLFANQGQARGEICEIKNKSRIEELSKTLVDKIGQVRFDQEKKELEERIFKVSDKMIKFVSGKDYLLPLLIDKVKHFVKGNASTLSVKIGLAEYCDIKELSELKRFVIA
jgi:uncharacterized protein DUF4435